MVGKNLNVGEQLGMVRNKTALEMSLHDLGKLFVLLFRGASLVCLHCGCWLRVASMIGSRWDVCTARHM